VVFTVAAQRCLAAARFPSVSDDFRVDIRIGVNTGDVVEHEGLVSGEAVHAAARLVDQAAAGEVLVSDVVKHLVGTVPDVHFLDRGTQELRGFSEPVRVWALAWPADEVVKVVIAEDSILLRHGVARVVRDMGYEVVEETGDADGLLRAVETARPDLIITDVRMPPPHSTEGLTAAVMIRRAHPEMAIVVLSQYVEPSFADELLQEGATAIAYLLKDRVTHVREFQQTLREVVGGGTAIDPEVVSALVDRPRTANPLDVLSPRERDVLRLMAEGRSNQAIGDSLYLSPRTVESHVKSIFTKLDFTDQPSDHRRVLAVVAYLRSLGARPTLDDATPSVT